MHKLRRPAATAGAACQQLRKRSAVKLLVTARRCSGWSAAAWRRHCCGCSIAARQHDMQHARHAACRAEHDRQHDRQRDNYEGAALAWQLHLARHDGCWHVTGPHCFSTSCTRSSSCAPSAPSAPDCIVLHMLGCGSQKASVRLVCSWRLIACMLAVVWRVCMHGMCMRAMCCSWVWALPGWSHRRPPVSGAI